MRNSKTSLKTVSALFCLLLCFSCAGKQAAIVNRNKNFYGKYNSYNKEKYRNLGKKTVAKSRSQDYQIKVGTNETVYTIAKKFHVPLRDLIKKNNLNPPYELAAGVMLTIPAPNYHEVESGETIYSIARSYQMNIDSLVDLNNLKSPYKLEVGQKLRVMQSDSNSSDSADDDSDNSAPKNSVEKVEVEKQSQGFVERTLDKLNHFSWPVNGEVISQFGPKVGGLYNDGINIKASEGDDVRASEDGIVSYAGNELKGYGNLVILKHSGGWITAYAHLSKISVKRGQKIKKMVKIGEVGSTGNVTSPQLYFGLRKGRDAVNPENYLVKK